jgi:hypothetical protein
MANLEALLEAGPAGAGKKCPLGRYLEELPEPYNEALRDLVGGTIAAIMVSNRLKAAGLIASEKLVQRHRRGICGCPMGAAA